MTPPVFVPVALKLDEAHALLSAAGATFDALSLRGLAALHGAELARAMITLAAAMSDLNLATDELLAEVHDRLGGVGLDITTFGNHRAEIRWRRSYGAEGLSDERIVGGASLAEALREVLAYEDWADSEDANVIAREASEAGS